jgi:hypothetical protein
MPRFRSLTQEELKALETEFKQFLIINQLYDKEWRELAAKDPQKAQEFIDLFSDIVLEKTYSKAQGLVQMGRDFIALFFLQETKWQFMHFQFQHDIDKEGHDLTRFLSYLQTYLASVNIQKGVKNAPANKAESVHQIIVNGAQLLNTEMSEKISVFFQD